MITKTKQELAEEKTAELAAMTPYERRMIQALDEIAVNVSLLIDIYSTLSGGLDGICTNLFEMGRK